MSEELKAKIISIINEPIFGMEFYNKEMLTELFEKLETIKTTFDIEELKDSDKIEIIERYLRENAEIRLEYFKARDIEDNKYLENELIYRTAYATLVMKNGACYGYAEALRLLLALYDISSITLLSKLPGEKYKSIHYTTVAMFEDNQIKKYKIIDPERHSYCEYKNRNFGEYLEDIIYITPTEKWYKHKLDNFGTGPLAKELLDDKGIKKVKGYSNLQEILNQYN